MGSGYQQRERAGKLTASDTCTLLDAVKLADRLLPFFEAFPESQMHFFVFERLAEDPKIVLQELYSFLGVDHQWVPEGISEIVNSAVQPKSRWLAKMATHTAGLLRSVGAYRIPWRFASISMGQKVIFPKREQKLRILESICPKKSWLSSNCKNRNYFKSFPTCTSIGGAMNRSSVDLEKIPFFKASIGDEEIASVVETLKSGWLTSGPKVKRFEKEFAEFVGAPYAVAVNSATAGLHLALEARGIGPGDEVLVPTHTFAATAEVVIHLGARPVLVDCQPDTLNLCLDDMKTKTGSKTKAVMPVHFAGHPCEMDEINGLG